MDDLNLLSFNKWSSRMGENLPWIACWVWLLDWPPAIAQR